MLHVQNNNLCSYNKWAIKLLLLIHFVCMNKKTLFILKIVELKYLVSMHFERIGYHLRLFLVTEARTCIEVLVIHLRPFFCNTATVK